MEPGDDRASTTTERCTEWPTFQTARRLSAKINTRKMPLHVAECVGAPQSLREHQQKGR